MRRAATDNEVLVVTFADVLEQLESKFYEQALGKFKDGDFKSAGFQSSQIPLEQFKVIQGDEATHSKALRGLLKSFGKQPVDSCKFNFDAALKDVATMAATARVVENVGVGAYLGAATLVTDPVLLTTAGSILTTEARHQTILNMLNGGSAIPSPFDIALAPPEVLALAGPFISGCDLGVKANPSLSITNQGTPGPGTKLTFKADTLNGTISEDKLFCQMLIGGAVASISLPLQQCIVPDGINGPVAIWLTSDSQPLVNNVRDRATTQIVAGPTMAFIDTQKEALAAAARGSSAPSDSSSSTPTAAASETTSTTTVSFDDANSLVNGAVATSSGSSPSPTNASGPNEFKGKNADGSITVNGWDNLPKA
jgi:hypothetical protein